MVLLNDAHFICNCLVLYGFAQPSGVIRVAKMMGPRFVVDALSQLREHIHIVRSQIQLSARSTKIETLVFAKFSGSILASMPANLRFRRFDGHGHGLVSIRK